MSDQQTPNELEKFAAKLLESQVALPVEDEAILSSNLWDLIEGQPMCDQQTPETALLSHSTEAFEALLREAASHRGDPVNIAVWARRLAESFCAAADQERARLREALKRHLSEADDPCGNCGAEWPCDVARALNASSAPAPGQSELEATTIQAFPLSVTESVRVLEALGLPKTKGFRHNVDHACARCVGDEEMVKAGFVCLRHRLIDWIDQRAEGQ